MERKELIETFFIIAIFTAITLSVVYIQYLFLNKLNSIIMIVDFVLIMLFAWGCYWIGGKIQNEVK